MVKLPSGEIKKATSKHGQLEVTKLLKPTTSAVGQKPEQKADKKEVQLFIISKGAFACNVTVQNPASHL